MSNRNPPPNLGELLLQPNFGQSRSLDKPGDPIVPTQLLLDVTKIRRYEQDPRQHANPQFEEIKASILAQGGLNNPLTVTRRPGEAHYIIEAGGNTRLRALQELWEATGDERFHFTHVLFKPWESESQILTRRMSIENAHLLLYSNVVRVRERCPGRTARVLPGRIRIRARERAARLPSGCKPSCVRKTLTYDQGREMAYRLQGPFQLSGSVRGVCRR